MCNGQLQVVPQQDPWKKGPGSTNCKGTETTSCLQWMLGNRKPKRETERKGAVRGPRISD